MSKSTSITKDQKEKAASATKTTGRQLSDEKAKNKESKHKSFSTIKEALGVAKSLPLPVKAAFVGYFYNEHKLKKAEKNMNNHQKQLQKMQTNAQNAGSDPISNAFNKVMLQYERERLEKLQKRIEKRTERSNKNKKFVNTVLRSLTSSVDAMARKSTVEAFAGDTRGISKDAMISANVPNKNINAQPEPEM